MYIGVDLGTTAVKAALYDGSLNLVAQYGREYGLGFEKGRPVQDAEVWGEEVFNAIRSVAEGYERQVRAICVDTQGISFVPADSDGKPLCAAVSWLDADADGEVEAIQRDIGKAEIYAVTGKPLRSVYTLPKLLRMRRENPRVFERADRFLFAQDYLNLLLCGRAVCDYSMASATMLYDINAREWNGRILEYAAITPQKLPQTAPMGTPLGKLLPGAAKKLGLSESVTVVLGAQDQKAAALGAGIRDGVCTVSLGTATAVSCFDAAPTSGFPRFAFDEKRIITEASLDTTGAAIKWLSGLLATGYSEMDRLARQAGGSGGVRFSCDFTSGAAIEGMALATEAGNVIYALYEDIARRIGELCAGLGAREIRVFGGAAASDILLEILADTTGLRVGTTDCRECAALGAAMLAKQATEG